MQTISNIAPTLLLPCLRLHAFGSGDYAALEETQARRLPTRDTVLFALIF